MTGISQLLERQYVPHHRFADHAHSTTYESALKDIVDDVCAAVPFYMRPQDPEAILNHYPHPPDRMPPLMSHGPELVASMTLVLGLLYAASTVDATPTSQRQWIQQYMTLLSGNPAGSAKKAMKLEINLLC